jgi:hypothetical protein
MYMLSILGIPLDSEPAERTNKQQYLSECYDLVVFAGQVGLYR